jgi:hypothetical protein
MDTHRTCAFVPCTKLGAPDADNPRSSPSIAARRTGSTNSTEAGRIAEQNYSSAKIPRSVPYLLKGTYCSGIGAAGEGRDCRSPQGGGFSEHAFSTAPGGKTVSRQMDSTERDRRFESRVLQRRVSGDSVRHRRFDSQPGLDVRHHRDEANLWPGQPPWRRAACLLAEAIHGVAIARAPGIGAVQTRSGQRTTIGEDRIVEMSAEDANCLIRAGWTKLAEWSADAAG